METKTLLPTSVPRYVRYNGAKSADTEVCTDTAEYEVGSIGSRPAADPPRAASAIPMACPSSTEALVVLQYESGGCESSPHERSICESPLTGPSFARGTRQAISCDQDGGRLVLSWLAASGLVSLRLRGAVDRAEDALRSPTPTYCTQPSCGRYQGSGCAPKAPYRQPTAQCTSAPRCINLARSAAALLRNRYRSLAIYSNEPTDQSQSWHPPNPTMIMRIIQRTPWQSLPE